MLDCGKVSIEKNEKRKTFSINLTVLFYCLMRINLLSVVIYVGILFYLFFTKKYDCFFFTFDSGTVGGISFPGHYDDGYFSLHWKTWSKLMIV